MSADKPSKEISRTVFYSCNSDLTQNDSIDKDKSKLKKDEIEEIAEDDSTDAKIVMEILPEEDQKCHEIITQANKETPRNNTSTFINCNNNKLENKENEIISSITFDISNNNKETFMTFYNNASQEKLQSVEESAKTEDNNNNKQTKNHNQQPEIGPYRLTSNDRELLQDFFNASSMANKNDSPNVAKSGSNSRKESNSVSFAKTGLQINKLADVENETPGLESSTASKLNGYEEKTSIQTVNQQTQSINNEISFPCGCTWSKFPVCISVAAMIGIFTTYTIARLQCHVQHFWVPYISYTGNYHPEHMIFGMVLNSMSFLYAFVIILVWRFMASLQPTEKRYHQNTCAVGLGSCIGLSIVANFQAKKAPYMHYMGAFCGFVLATCYILLVTQILASISKSFPKILPRWLIKLRWIVSSTGAISFVACFLITSIAPLVPEFESHKEDYYEDTSNPNCQRIDNNVLKKSEDNKLVLPNYTHQYNLVWSIGALFEWINATCWCIYMGLFYFEFQYFRHVKIVLKDVERNPLTEYPNGVSNLALVQGSTCTNEFITSDNSEQIHETKTKTTTTSHEEKRVIVESKVESKLAQVKVPLAKTRSKSIAETVTTAVSTISSPVILCKERRKKLMSHRRGRSMDGL